MHHRGSWKVTQRRERWSWSVGKHCVLPSPCPTSPKPTTPSRSLLKLHLLGFLSFPLRLICPHPRGAWTLLPPCNSGRSFSVDNLNASCMSTAQGDLKGLRWAPGNWSLQCPLCGSHLGLSAPLDTALRMCSSSTVATHTTSRGPAIFCPTILTPVVWIPSGSPKHS